MPLTSIVMTQFRLQLNKHRMLCNLLQTAMEVVFIKKGRLDKVDIDVQFVRASRLKILKKQSRFMIVEVKSS